MKENETYFEFAWNSSNPSSSLLSENDWKVVSKSREMGLSSN